MRILIIANGELTHPIETIPEDIIIAVNGGVHHCIHQTIKPDFVIGDLDSLDASHLKVIKSFGSELITHPTRKNSTDLDLALRFALKRKPPEIKIYAALGYRWDQTLVNILLVSTITSTRIQIIDSSHVINFLHSKQTLEINGDPQDIVSLIPLNGDAKGITTKGLEYPLNNETLFYGSTRGISNVLLSTNAQVYLESGYLCCTVHKSPLADMKEARNE